MSPDVWFRYEPCDRGYGDVGIVCEEYTVTKTTPCGVWLHRSCGVFQVGKDRFVLRAARKRFACPTRAEALASFIARKERYRRILLARLDNVEALLLEAHQEQALSQEEVVA